MSAAGLRRRPDPRDRHPPPPHDHHGHDDSPAPTTNTGTSPPPLLAPRSDQPPLTRARYRGGCGRPWTGPPPILGGAPSQPLDVGRTSRVITPAQRAALAVRDGGCVVPDCDRPLAWCEGHHLLHWLDGGPTDLANLALVCRAHHRALHEGGWQLTRGPDGQLTATPPDRHHRRHRRHPTAA
jgi:hypothetical protein